VTEGIQVKREYWPGPTWTADHGEGMAEWQLYYMTETSPSWYKLTEKIDHPHDDYPGALWVLLTTFMENGPPEARSAPRPTVANTPRVYVSRYDHNLEPGRGGHINWRIGERCRVIGSSPDAGRVFVVTSESMTHDSAPPGSWVREGYFEDDPTRAIIAGPEDKLWFL
jgi:hypothetical protein